MQLCYFPTVAILGLGRELAVRSCPIARRLHLAVSGLHRLPVLLHPLHRGRSWQMPLRLPLLLKAGKKDRRWLFVCVFLLVSILDSNQTSPVTPIATKPAPNNPTANKTLLGLSGGCTT